MAKLEFEHLKTVTSKGLTEDEAQESINSVITNSIGEGRSIEDTEDGLICITTHGLLGSSTLYYYIESRVNKHSIEVAHDSKEYFALQAVVVAVLLTLFNVLFLKLDPFGSMILGLCGVVVLIIINLIVAYKARKNAGIDCDEIKRALAKAENDGLFGK